MKFFNPLLKRNQVQNIPEGAEPGKSVKPPENNETTLSLAASAPYKNSFSRKETETLFSSISGSIAPEKFRKGDILILEGEIEEELYLILSGRFRVEKKVDEKINILGTIGTGAMVGQLALIAKQPSHASIIATEQSRVACINKSRLKSLSPGAQLVILRQVTRYASQKADHLLSTQQTIESRNRQLEQHMFELQTGADDAYLKSKMINSVIAKIPRLPVFAATLASRMLSDRISSREVAEMIKKDPAVAGLVLKTVNSPVFGCEHKIADITHAAMLIGIPGIYQLIMAEGIRQAIPNTPVFNQLYLHSQSVCHLAHGISMVTKTGKPSEIATIGLMHELGNIVVELLKKQNQKVSDLVNLIDPAKLGSLLLKSWNLPEVVYDSVYFQSYPRFSSPMNIPAAIRENVAILYTAHLFHDRLRKKPGNEKTIFITDYMGLLNWKTHSIEAALETHLLPALRKRINSYPAHFRNLLNAYASQGTK